MIMFMILWVLIMLSFVKCQILKIRGENQVYEVVLILTSNISGSVSDVGGSL